VSQRYAHDFGVMVEVIYFDAHYIKHTWAIDREDRADQKWAVGISMATLCHAGAINRVGQCTNVQEGELWICLAIAGRGRIKGLKVLKRATGGGRVNKPIKNLI
jgi:hypothetical protein